MDRMRDDFQGVGPQTATMGGKDEPPIVVIEDDDDLRPEIAQYLRRRKRRVVACASIAAAREALEKAEKDAASPLAIISDIGLPDGDGLDLYLAFAGRLPASRWILMSGSHDLERLHERLQTLAGVRAPIVVEKPVSLRVLQDLVEGDTAKKK
jgi:DNA-binding NtrC family response regulator